MTTSRPPTTRWLRSEVTLVTLRGDVEDSLNIPGGGRLTTKGILAQAGVPFCIPSSIAYEPINNVTVISTPSITLGGSATLKIDCDSSQIIVFNVTGPANALRRPVDYRFKIDLLVVPIPPIPPDPTVWYSI